MDYFFKEARGKFDRELRGAIEAAASRLHEKLRKTDLKKTGISEYNTRYLSSKLALPDASLRLYSYLIALAFTGGADADRAVMLDYGGGSGMMSFLAKELGVGKVIYNDIYDVSCADVRKMSSALGLELFDVVCGDINDVINRLNGTGTSVDVLVSYDVIEHIYDIESFLRTLNSVPHRKLRVVLGSGANDRNPVLRKRLMKQHVKFEYENRAEEKGRKERDSTTSYLEMRKEIIAAKSEKLSGGEIENLARMTRGLMKSDIERCVDLHLKGENIRYNPDHPTNTCDPATGNWAEHLMDQKKLLRALLESGFDARIESGYYHGESGGGMKKAVSACLNKTISILGSGAVPLAPFFVLVADTL